MYAVVADEPFLNRVPLLEDLVNLKQPVPSPGGQVSGMAGTSAKPGRSGGGVWHPADLPEGYHAAPRGKPGNLGREL